MLRSSCLLAILHRPFRVRPARESRHIEAVRDRQAAELWIRSFVRPTAPIEVARERPWATVLRVPIAGGSMWFKASTAVQAFEPRLSADLFARWPHYVAEVRL